MTAFAALLAQELMFRTINRNRKRKNRIFQTKRQNLRTNSRSLRSQMIGFQNKQ